MEGFHYRPPEHTNPEEPFGPGTLEVNSTGEVEVTKDDEARQQRLKLLELLVRIVRHIRSNVLLRAVLESLPRKK